MIDSIGPKRDRLEHLDLLRGVAILGILLVNIQSFALPIAEFYQPGLILEFSGSDRWVQALVKIFAEWKFLALLSLMFGAGIWLFSARLEARGAPAGKLHYRRCRWLLLFGLLHAYLFWYGDILFTYAVCAMLAWPLRHKSIKTQLVLASAGLLICALLYWLTLEGLYRDLGQEQIFAAMPEFSPEGARQQIEQMRAGWLQQMPLRAEWAFTSQFEILFFGFRVVALMLLGMVLMRTGWLNPAASIPTIWPWACFILGLASAVFGYLQSQASENLAAKLMVDFHYPYWSSILLALAYARGFVLWCRSNVGQALQRRLTAVGRTALSCYLLQTLIGTSLFYGHGLGLYAQLDRTQLLFIVLAIWVLLLWLAPLWLRHFYYGPVEWLWRGLTYRHWPQLRRNSSGLQ